MKFGHESVLTDGTFVLFVTVRGLVKVGKDWACQRTWVEIGLTESMNRNFFGQFTQGVKAGVLSCHGKCLQVRGVACDRCVE